MFIGWSIKKFMYERNKRHKALVSKRVYMYIIWVSIIYCSFLFMGIL